MSPALSVLLRQAFSLLAVMQGDCTRTYNVGPGDTCNSISIKMWYKLPASPHFLIWQLALSAALKCFGAGITGGNMKVSQDQGQYWNHEVTLICLLTRMSVITKFLFVVYKYPFYLSTYSTIYPISEESGLREGSSLPSKSNEKGVLWTRTVSSGVSLSVKL